MEKIQHYKRMVNTNTKGVELYLYNYVIFKNINDIKGELKLVSVVQDINQNIYDLKEDDFVGDMFSLLEKVAKIIDKDIKDLANFYEIKTENMFMADEFFLFEDEVCKNCSQNGKVHLMVRTLKMRGVLFLKGLNQKIEDSVVSIYINTKTPKITTCILNKKTGVIQYEILVYKHNCNDKNCDINGKIIYTIKEFDYSGKEFEDKMELIKNYGDIQNYIIKDVLIDNPKDIEKELLQDITKIVDKKDLLISKGDGTPDISKSIFLSKFEIDLNLWK